jgi:hypothetical protein
VSVAAPIERQRQATPSARSSSSALQFSFLVGRAPSAEARRHPGGRVGRRC